LALEHEGRAAGIRRPKGYFLSDYAESITHSVAQASLNHHNLPRRRCDCCDRHAPRLTRYVERLDGGSTDACRSCFLRLTAAERHAALVARFHNLFRHLPPWVFGLRGAGLEAAYA